jgi:hypothetical protein
VPALRLPRRKQASSFLKKRSKKAFDYFGFGVSGLSELQFAKVFWFFFSKKNCLLPLSLPPHFVNAARPSIGFSSPGNVYA